MTANSLIQNYPDVPIGNHVKFESAVPSKDSSVGNAPSGWSEWVIRDLAPKGGLVGGPFGSSLGTKDYVGLGVPVIRGQNLGSDGRFDGSEFVYVSEGKADELKRNIAIPGDLVFTQRGTLGQVGIVPAGHFERYVISQSQMRLRPDPEVADFDFLYYVFRSPQMLDMIGSRAIVTGVPHINLGILGDFHVLLPPLPEQRAIAGVLGALDDKIESNRRIIENALAIIVLELQLAEDEEWIEIGVSEIADFVNGGAFTKDASGTGRMVIRIAELNSGPGASTVYNEIEVPDEKTARVGDILMAWSGSLGVHYWTRAEAIINQHIFKVVCTNFPSWFVYDRLCRAMPEFKQTAADKATTMGHIKRHHLDDTKVVVPAPEVLQTLNQELGPIWDRVMSAEIENHSLVALRNALLPELLSGRLRVKDAESMMENV